MINKDLKRRIENYGFARFLEGVLAGSIISWFAWRFSGIEHWFSLVLVVLLICSLFILFVEDKLK